MQRIEAGTMPWRRAVRQMDIHLTDRVAAKMLE
jgi:hypothetical protein